ncbi:hypothetical protein Vadar_029028 [Vaccinium darrowii]|uniref:Uncharacterized protein n=1 Tax=Vaccinium darrowii TaxID=229202 RepID=A0ACB7ZMK6_9ERIC|nr:hypothetical protein Vadar_029028 [Vaccinium darrowii]
MYFASRLCWFRRHFRNHGSTYPSLAINPSNSNMAAELCVVGTLLCLLFGGLCLARAALLCLYLSFACLWDEFVYQKHNLSRNQTLNSTVSLAPPPPSTSDTSSRRRAKPITDLGGNHNPIAFSFLNLMGVFQSSKFLPMGIPLLSWLFFFTHIFIISVSGQCLHEQKSLLLQLKNNLTFNPSISTRLTNWNQTLDCCKWNGVTCDRNGYVAGLDLNSESISNGIGCSSTLFSLRYLEALNLASNSFNSTAIPSSIGNLTNLVYLNLSNSGFSGQIPIELSFLTRLVTLDLSTTASYFPPIQSLQIQNPNLSTLFGNLSGIKELHLDGVNISANGYEWGRAISSSLPNLRVLSLSNCYLSGPIDDSLQDLQNLSEINLGSNNLSSLVPDFFVNFPHLTVLRLSFSNLYGTFPENILQRVQTLGTLDLTSNPLLNGSLHGFPENGSLRNLVLTDTRFSGDLPQSIGNLMELRRIEIPRCYFSGPIPSSLANLSHLVYLDFSSNNFSGPIPSFQISKNLTYIDLSYNTLTGVVPSTYFEGLLNLVYIDLAYNSFNGSIPSSLFSLPSLQKILLSNNKFGGQIFVFSNESLSPLDTLDLSSNKLEGPIPSHFFDFLRLDILSVSFNNFSGTVALESIQRLKNLTKLELSYNNLMVDVSFNISILSSFPQLTVLSLASCNLRKFPALMNQSRVIHLDLSGNKISGVIPNWIWNVGDGKLAFLNLSCNLLVGLQSVYMMPSLTVLDLHSNQLSGEIPIPPEAAIYVDYAGNKFNSSIPAEVGNGIASAVFFSLSNNMLSGPIPPSICNGSYLQRKAMMDGGNAQPYLNHLRFGVFTFNKLYYQDSVTVINKGCKETEPPTPTFDGRHSYSDEEEINWVYITATLGYTIGFGVIVGPLLCCKRWRRCYYKHVDQAILRILHHQERRARNQRRRDNRNVIRRRQHH